MHRIFETLPAPTLAIHSRVTTALEGLFLSGDVRPSDRIQLLYQTKEAFMIQSQIP